MIMRPIRSMTKMTMARRPPSLSFPTTTAETLQCEARQVTEKFLAAINDIKQQPQQPPSNSNSTNGADAQSTFASLSLALGEASASSARVTLPSMIHDDAAVRAASHAAKDDFKSMFDETLSDGALYEALIRLEGGEKMENEEDGWFQRNILRALRRNGCAIESPSDRSALQIKRRQIEETCTAFCATINEHDEYLFFTETELDGMEDHIDRFAIDEKTHKRKIGLKAPDTLPLLKFCKNAKTRRTVMVALSKKCQVENTPRFVEVIRLRDECAKLLGYKNHADYMCETKMVGSPQRAEEFLLELVDAYEPIRKRELELLLDMKQKDVLDGNDADSDATGGSKSVTLDPWDIPYYTRRYKAECAGVDEGALRKYFPLEHVKSTILTIYEELLELKFERVADAEVWHEDVECYAVRSASPNGSGKDGSEEDDVLGHFYLDIFPRKGKYSHQCVYPLRPSFGTGKDRILPACVNIGNLTPSREGSPSLLLFREVETFFHEFGHVCHCVLTNARHSLHSWAWSAVPWPGGVEQDFLEVPSMMLENFVWCPEVLRRLSKHVTDGTCLPESTIDALSQSRFLMTGYTKSKYLAMSLYDLKVHSGPGPYVFEGKEYDAVSLYNVMIEKYTGVVPVPESFAAASWFHLLMGYDAGYYGYIYSETFAADLYSKFSELSHDGKPVIDANLGKKYRDKILSPCATIDGEGMLVNFLGREPSKDAFLRSRILM